MAASIDAAEELTLIDELERLFGGEPFHIDEASVDSSPSPHSQFDSGTEPEQDEPSTPLKPGRAVSVASDETCIFSTTEEGVQAETEAEADSVASLESTQALAVNIGHPHSSAADAYHEMPQRFPTPILDDDFPVTTEADDTGSIAPRDAPTARRAYIQEQHNRERPRRSARVPAAKKAKGVTHPIPEVVALSKVTTPNLRVRGRRTKPKTHPITSVYTRRFEVERILDSRIEADTYKHFYLVKWKNFSNNAATWEQKRMLMEDAPEAIHEYHAQHGYQRH